MYMSWMHYNRLNHNLVEGMSLRGAENGNLWTSPPANPTAIGPNSGLLPIKAISCHGCDAFGKQMVDECK